MAVKYVFYSNCYTETEMTDSGQWAPLQ